MEVEKIKEPSRGPERRREVSEAEKGKETPYRCCEYFEPALDPNILRAYAGYCRARAWPFTVMVPIGGFDDECPKPPIKKKA